MKQWIDSNWFEREGAEGMQGAECTHCKIHTLTHTSIFARRWPPAVCPRSNCGKVRRQQGHLNAGAGAGLSGEDLVGDVAEGGDRLRAHVI